MTIDTKELRFSAANSVRDLALLPSEVLELIDRLEAAEKESALRERVIDALGSELNAVANERDALRDKLAEMEWQKPVGFLDGDGRAILQRELHPWADLYALPVVAPKLDEIKTALQRALELGQRETWTGARKHRSWEDQREEQQCWNKVWSLLGTQGEGK